MNQDLERIMITEEQIAGRVREVAVQLDKLYEGRRPVVVCILKGSVMFFPTSSAIWKRRWSWISWRCPPMGAEPLPRAVCK